MNEKNFRTVKKHPLSKEEDIEHLILLEEDLINGKINHSIIMKLIKKYTVT